MKTPANPFTIHVIDAHDVVPYIAAPRPSIVNRVRPYIAEALTGLVQTGRVAGFVVTELSRMIVGIGIGLVKGVRVFYYALLVMLEFLFVKIPVFIVGLIVLIMAIGFGYSIVDALYRGFHHLPLH